MARWMIANEEVIMTLVVPTSGTVGTIARIAAMNHMSDRKNAMRPRNKEVRTAAFARTELAIKGPVDVKRKGPLT